MPSSHSITKTTLVDNNTQTGNTKHVFPHIYLLAYREGGEVYGAGVYMIFTFTE